MIVSKLMTIICLNCWLTGMKQISNHKYSGSEGCMTTIDECARVVDEKYRSLFVDLVNKSQAANSWRQLKSVLKLVRMVQQQDGIELWFPWREDKLLNFMLALARRGLLPSTITVYVSRIKMYHRLKGKFVYLYFIKYLHWFG